MKIVPLDPKLAALNPVSERKTPAQTGTPTTATPSTEVQLSEVAQLAAKQLDAGFDAEKVQRMAQAIKNGTFEANPDAIADKLIANAREQLAKTYR